LRGHKKTIEGRGGIGRKTAEQRFRWVGYFICGLRETCYRALQSFRRPFENVSGQRRPEIHRTTRGRGPLEADEMEEIRWWRHVQKALRTPWEKGNEALRIPGDQKFVECIGTCRIVTTCRNIVGRRQDLQFLEKELDGLARKKTWFVWLEKLWELEGLEGFGDLKVLETVLCFVGYHSSILLHRDQLSTISSLAQRSASATWPHIGFRGDPTCPQNYCKDIRNAREISRKLAGVKLVWKSVESVWSSPWKAL
jgi:hypothetical protein